MKNKLFPLTVLIVISVFITSCEDFIATDLTKKSMTVLAPANNTVLSNFTPLFKWEELKGADRYQLQIVKPNFAAIAQFILDTSTTSTQFSFTLTPGNYQWRVRAKNNSGSTEYVTYNLTIDSSSSLAGSTVILKLPHNNFFTNVMANTFTWEAMPSATSYIFQILSPDGSSAYLQSTPAFTMNYTFAAEGSYQWKVLAQNSLSSSIAGVYNITIDTTKPLAPLIVFPLADTITANPVPLKWNAAANTDYSHILISSDSTFGSIAVDTVIPFVTNPIVYNFYGASVGTPYFWKVRGEDKAGNKGVYFYRRRFKRN